MADIFSAAGLPDELADFDDLDSIAREQTELRITTDSRRYGKMMTIVSGMDDPGIDKKRILKDLKARCACGGALKDGHIELQGDHAKRVRQALEAMGFRVQS